MRVKLSWHFKFFTVFWDIPCQPKQTVEIFQLIAPKNKIVTNCHVGIILTKQDINGVCACLMNFSEEQTSEYNCRIYGFNIYLSWRNCANHPPLTNSPNLNPGSNSRESVLMYIPLRDWDKVALIPLLWEASSHAQSSDFENYYLDFSKFWARAGTKTVLCSFAAVPLHKQLRRCFLVFSKFHTSANPNNISPRFHHCFTFLNKMCLLTMF